MGAIYRSILRPLLFSRDSEKVHDELISLLSAVRGTHLCSVLNFFSNVNDSRFCVPIGDLTFPNPIGLAAGFDKNAAVFEIFEALSFGHVEVGTITKHPQEGNPRPRIFRIPSECALINRMGFPSVGIDHVLPRLKEIAGAKRRSIIGINIGKSKITPIDEASEEYAYLYSAVAPYADYVTINVSSPNTPELRTLQEPARLSKLFRSLKTDKFLKPVFVKVSPDLSTEELDQVVGVCVDSKIDGIIATNTSIARDTLKIDINETGGLSGTPIRQRSLSVIRAIYRLSKGQIPIVAVGGISSSNDVIDAYRAGASLVQLYTSLIYEGPFVASSILKGLANYMNNNGLLSVLQLRGES